MRLAPVNKQNHITYFKELMRDIMKRKIHKEEQFQRSFAIRVSDPGICSTTPVPSLIIRFKHSFISSVVRLQAVTASKADNRYSINDLP